MGESAVAQVYRANVYSYASLAAAQPVRIFVSGFVNRPGLYNGTSMDSLLHYLDQAGGIDVDRGSFLAVQVKRGNTVRAEVSLYDFLLDGRMPLVQLAQERNVAIIAIMHLNKKADNMMIQRIAGASSYGQIARHIIFMGNDPDDTNTGSDRRRATG